MSDQIHVRVSLPQDETTSTLNQSNPSSLGNRFRSDQLVNQQSTSRGLRPTPVLLLNTFDLPRSRRLIIFIKKETSNRNEILDYSLISFSTIIIIIRISFFIQHTLSASIHSRKVEFTCSLSIIFIEIYIYTLDDTPTQTMPEAALVFPNGGERGVVFRVVSYKKTCWLRFAAN